MSYYIAPQSESYNSTAIYRVVKRLKDFKPEEGKNYRVFHSKIEMETAWFVPIYKGEKGRLKKLPYDFVIRFPF